MRLVVGFFHALGGHVCINLCRRERLVTEQLLNTPQVRPAVEQVRGETVAKRVWADGWIKTADGQVLVELTADTSCAEPLPVFVHIKSFLVEVHRTRVGSSHFHIAFDPGERGGRYRCDTFFLALASDMKGFAHEIDVRDVEIHKFTHANTSRVERLEHGPVSCTEQGTRVRCFEQSANLVLLEELG